METDSRTRAIRHIRTLLALAFAGAVAWVLGQFLLLLFAGGLLAVALATPAGLLSRHTPLPYKLCVLLVILAATAAILAVSWGVAPDVARQIDQMRSDLPKALEGAKAWVTQYDWGRDLVQAEPDASDLASSGRLWRTLTSAFSGTFTAMANVVLVSFIGLYVAIEPRLYRRGLLALVPQPQRERAGELLDESVDVLQRWLFGTLLSMATIGLLTWLGLVLLGVPLALTLALLASLFTFIPNIGPVLSAIPAVLLASLQGPSQVLSVVALYVGAQAIESYVVTPFIQRRTVSLPPALTLSAQFVLGLLGGVIGLFVATPMTAVLLTVGRRMTSAPRGKDDGEST